MVCTADEDADAGALIAGLIDETSVRLALERCSNAGEAVLTLLLVTYEGRKLTPSVRTGAVKNLGKTSSSLLHLESEK